MKKDLVKKPASVRGVEAGVKNKIRKTVKTVNVFKKFLIFFKIYLLLIFELQFE